MTTTPTLEAALTYRRELGWSVLPIGAAKKPALDSWKQFQQEPADEQTIRGWWRATPTAGVGVVTGPVSDLLVVDADTTDAYTQLLGMGLPATPRARTKNGGHWYMAYPSGADLRNTVKNADGIDTRGRGGYVVAPPSPHPQGGQYTWEVDPRDVRPAALPAELLALIYGPPADSDHGADGEAAGDAIARLLAEGAPKGQRNDAAARLAGHFLARQLPAVEVVAILLPWAEKCHPPLPRAEVRAVVESIARTEARRHQQQPDEPASRDSAATQLVKIAQRVMPLFRDQYGLAHTEAEKGGALALHRQAVRRRLARDFYKETGKTAGAEAISQALQTLAGLADERPTGRLAVRVARQVDTIRVDLAHDSQQVEITATGWSTCPLQPATFRRYDVQAPLAIADTTGTPADLLALIGLIRASEDDRLLLACWLVAALFADLAHPIIALHGPKGSSKTTTARLLTAVIDPSGTDLLSEPRDETQVAVAAEKRWLLGYDNLSRLQPWLSDLLCRTSTGGSIARRTLYTDADETLFDLRRLVVLTSVPQVAQAEDLLDRLLPLRLAALPDADRLPEHSWNARVAALLPRALGGLYTAAAGVLARLARGERYEGALPRLADWAEVAALAACELDRTQQDFRTAWAGALDRQAAEAADTSQLPSVLAHFMMHQKTPADTPTKTWQGTATELVNALTRVAEGMSPPVDTRATMWPTFRTLSRHLDTHTTALAALSLRVDHRTLHGRTLYLVTLAPPPVHTGSNPPNPPTPPAPEENQGGL